MTLKNMKFRVSGPEQSERLQDVLFSLGYKWTTGAVQYTEKPHLYAYDNGLIMMGDCDRHFDLKSFPEQDTEAFIAQHSATDSSFKGLESAYDNLTADYKIGIVLEPHSDSWKDNDGTMPDLPEGTLVEIAFKDGDVGSAPDIVENWAWEFEGQWDEIAKWRFHRPEDSEYYKQPKTPHLKADKITVKNSYGETVLLSTPMTNGSFSVNYTNSEGAPIMGYTYTTGDDAGYDIVTKEIPERAIDTHYNFNYELTQDDVDEGYIKVDPYFVSQQWQLGSKDSTGVIFHLLKTVARFGDKNSKEREINALHKSVLRLAQLEGVELK